MRASSCCIPLFRVLVACLCGLVLVSRGAAQAAGERSQHRLAQTRGELEGRLRQLEEMTQTGKFETVSPDFVRQETGYIQRRLTEGDFHVGDRVLIAVEDPMSSAGDQSSRPAERSTERQLSDTFTVDASQELTLPVLGRVSLRGVLRTELEPVLTQEIARYIRDPVVGARALVGLALTGELVRPGYYSVPADAVIPAVLMAAGGSTHEGKLNKLKIQRNGNTIWQGDALRRAIAAGTTVDELELQPGDVIVVPRSGSIAGLYGPAQLLAVLLGIPVTVYTLTKVF